MPAPSVIVELIERFKAHRESYLSGQYNEAQLREEFLNPFFEALGWDVQNKKGYSGSYKEVIHEDAIKVGGRTKAPDYCFRAGGGQRSFFVEAKKPSVDIAGAAGPAFQLRRYAWSAKLPVSILSDFEEFAVYDCRIRPSKDDKAAVARVIYLQYTEYLDQWDALFDLFSPEAIRRGSLERFVANKKIKKGTAEVDASFLEEIENWRYELAQNIALRNPEISQRDLNFAVQRVIDRIIFLRICEDRGIEPYGTLESLQNGTKTYRRLGELFRRADDRYNSGIFHFSPEKDRPEPPDEMTLGLEIDDKPLKNILGSLYFPFSPYEFSVFPIEILGHVYEQFLGKVIRLTKGHRAKVEEKPEVRKAGGVFYTPSYIVDYIVRETVGKMLEGNANGRLTPKEAEKLKILDPSCGSGSFLIGAYSFLLDWYREQYIGDDPEKHSRGKKPKLYRSAADEWRLTTAEKKRILLNNIYGVDIDRQAVEVTKLSLLLKVLEGESGETLANQLRIFHERALPDLGDNIKCGNSLIGSDYYNGNQLNLFNEEEQFRINVFDWNKEFTGIFHDGGFDAVIGNPPYGASADENQISYYRKIYGISSGTIDSFALFMEKAGSLLKTGGKFGMIVQSAFVSSPTMSKLRDFIIANFRPLAFASMPYDVFAAYVDTIVFTAQKLPLNKNLREFRQIPVQLVSFPPRHRIESLADFDIFAKTADASQWFRDGHNEFLVILSDAEHTIVDKLHRIKSKFADVADIQRGVTPFKTSNKMTKAMKDPAFAGTIRRYKCQEELHYMQYDQSLAEYKPPRYFQGPRILLRELISRQFRLQAMYVSNHFITNKSMQSILVTDKTYHPYYFLGLVNSRLLSWYFLAVHSVGRRDDFPKIVLKQTRELPFRKIDSANKIDNAKHERMVKLVETILHLQSKLESASNPHDITVIQRQIEATDDQIDRLVYDLYGLTEEEIALVEQSKQQ